MRPEKLNLCDFICEDNITEAADMTSFQGQNEEYKNSMFILIAKLNTLAFQLSSYTGNDRVAFQAKNVSTITTALRSIYDFFETKKQHQFTTLIQHNLDEFKKALQSNSTFSPKYSWNPVEDKQLSFQYSNSSTGIVPAQQIPPVNTGPEYKIDQTVINKTPIQNRIALDR